MAKQEVAGGGWKFPESYDFVDKTDPNLLYCVLVIPWVPFYWNLVSIRFSRGFSQSYMHKWHMPMVPINQFCVVFCFVIIHSIVNRPTL